MSKVWFRIAWKSKITEASGIGGTKYCMSKDLMEKTIEEMNEKYPEIVHYLVKVEPPEEVEDE